MSLFYSVAYRLGFTPWEAAGAHPAAAQVVTEVFNREEQGRTPPYGRALDLGCGRGGWSIVLAQRGWQVTGIDLVPAAVRAARNRARETGVDVQFLEGDLTALRRAGVGSGFRLLWDCGTVHGLNTAQREAVGREVNAVAADDASILTMAWAPGKRGLLPRGASRRDLEQTYPGWTVTDEEALDPAGLPPWARKVQPRLYRLRRG